MKIIIDANGPDLFIEDIKFSSLEIACPPEDAIASLLLSIERNVDLFDSLLTKLAEIFDQETVLPILQKMQSNAQIDIKELSLHKIYSEFPLINPVVIK